MSEQNESQISIERIAELLAEGLNPSQAARKLGLNPNTVYQAIYRAGYRIQKICRLVPVHASDLNGRPAG